MAILLVAAVVGALAISLRISALQNSALQNYLHQATTISLQVTTDPVLVAPKVVGTAFARPAYSFIGQATQVADRYRMRIPVRVIASTRSVAHLLPGQRITVFAKVLPSKERRVAALLIVAQQVTVESKASTFAHTLSVIRSGLRTASGSGDAGALIPGMVIGDVSKQSIEFKDEMRRSGLTHLVAVSGANFAIVSAFVLWAMQFIFRRKNFRILATALFLLAFIALVRPSPSVLRAAAMAAVLLYAHATRQGRDSLPALGFAITAVVFLDPFQARDPGFALSVLATAGLLLLAPKIRPQFLAPPIAALIFCAPVIVALSGYISPMSIVANVLVAPAVTPITIVGFIAALISPFSLQVAQALIFLIKPCAHWITVIAEWSSTFPVLTLATGTLGFLATILIVLLIYWGKRYVALALVVIILALAWLQRFPAGDWSIANCDVGQGDALVIHLQENRAIVIDVGSDPQIIDRCLHQLGIKVIPLLILTHSHADHVGGLAGVEKNRVVERTWYGNIAAGTKAHLDGIEIEVLWPPPHYGGDGNPNNSSIAAIFRSHDFTLFAAGDIEPPVQTQLESRIGRVDIYKVAHHGSRYQDAQLLRELSPSIALISVGAKNSYGHPATSTIAELTEIGAKVLRTDRDGAVAIHAERHRFTVQRSKRWLRFLYWN